MRIVALVMYGRVIGHDLRQVVAKARQLAFMEVLAEQAELGFERGDHCSCYYVVNRRAWF